MKFVYDDGGRKEAGYKGLASDCACRAIAISTGKPYKEIYSLINDYGKRERRANKSTARTGVWSPTLKKIMASIGWRWVPTMQIGSGCTTHLRADELPSGHLVVSLSGHEVAVIDGVIHDTYDCSRDGTRCVYGYFVKA